MSTEITAAGTAAATFAFGHDLIRQTTVTIASSGTTSGAVDLGGTTLAGLIMPASFTGTSVTFTVSDELAGTYRTVYAEDGVTAASADITAGGYIPLDYGLFMGARFIKIVSNATEAAAREIGVVSRPMGG